MLPITLESERELVREARLAVDVKNVSVTHENESESLREARLAAGGKRVSVAHDNKRELSIFKVQDTFTLF